MVMYLKKIIKMEKTNLMDNFFVYRSTMFLITLLFITISPLTLFAVDSYTAAGSARYAESALKVSRESIFFLDPILTNVSNQEQKQIYKQIVTKDLMARIYLRQFRYGKSYTESLIVQKNIVDLQKKILQVLGKETKALIDRFAPQILTGPVPNKNQPSYFLRMAYRDYTLAKTIEKKTDRVFPRTNYSQKIQGYNKSLERLNRARKYAFYAFLYFKTPMQERVGLEKLTFLETAKILWDLLEKAEDRSRLISLHYTNFDRLRYPSVKEKYFQGKDTQDAINKQTDLGTPTN